MHLCHEAEIPAPRAEVFAFFAASANLLRLHHAPFAVRILHHEAAVRVGGEMWVQVGIAGILPVVLGFRHNLFEPPACFGEVLIHGVFSRFDHRHEFDETATGTLVRDVLRVELPWYYGGEVAMKVLIGPQLKKAFAHRAETLQKLAQSGELSVAG